MVSKTPGVTEIIQGRRWRRQRRGPRLSAESFGGWIEEAGEGSKPMGLRGDREDWKVFTEATGA